MSKFAPPPPPPISSEALRWGRALTTFQKAGKCPSSGAAPACKETLNPKPLIISGRAKSQRARWHSGCEPDWYTHWSSFRGNAFKHVCTLDFFKVAYMFIPHPRCGVLEFKLNSFSGPVYSSPSPRVPNAGVPECAWSAQSQTVPRTPKSLECPTPECPGVPNPRVPWSAQPQSVPKFLWSARVSLECPTPRGVPKPRVFLERLTPECPWSVQPQSISTQRGWGCSK